MTGIYLDESKSKRYTVAAASIADADAARARKVLLAFRMKGQRRVHFVAESHPRRKEALALLTELNIKATLFVAPAGVSQSIARSACLTEFAGRLPLSKPSRVVIEQDDSMVEFDKRVMGTALRQRLFRLPVSYEHMRAVDEPLLWIPDAIVWSFVRGGEFRRRAAELITDVVEVAAESAKLGTPTVRKVAELTSRR
jgi:hypothetical protein